MTSATTEYDPFKGDPGLKDDFDGTIVETWFATDPNSNNPLTVNCYMKIMADDGEEVEPRWACGPDWATYDGGKTVEHPKATKGFNKSTKWFRVIASALEAGGEAMLRERSASVGEGLGPKSAAIWKGLRFHFKVIEEPYKFRNRDGEMIEGTSSTLMMAKFLGEASGDEGGTTAGATSTTSSSVSSPSSDPLGHLPAESRDAIVALAKAQPFDKFVDGVMAMDGMLDDIGVMSAISDEEYYKELRG